MSRPWMPLYIKDYRGDTARLTTLEHGAYLLLIMEYWDKGGLPDDDEELAYIAGLTAEEWTSVRPHLKRLFRDGWKHKRIDEELAEAESRYEKRANAGRKGGLAKAQTSNAKANSSNATPMPEQCSSSGYQPQPQPHLQSSSLRSEEISETSLRSVSVSETPVSNPEATTGEIIPFEPPAVAARKAKADRDLDLLDAITDLWNVWAKRYGSPLVRRLTGTRATHCRRRVADLLQFTNADTPQAAFAFLLDRCSESFFARGSPSKPLEFDQLMSEKFMTRMLEGSFQHREQRRGF